jgi:hypothetical protein
MLMVAALRIHLLKEWAVEKKLCIYDNEGETILKDLEMEEQ